MSKGTLIVFSGPSGVGKGTILQKYFTSSMGKNAVLSVSATTRLPRPNEVDGVNYHFMSNEEFNKIKAQDGFFECAEFCGNQYGTPKAKVIEKLEQGIDVILEIEVQGALKVKQQMPDAVMIFVLPPSFKVLRERLIGRATESEEVIDRRIQTALNEVKSINEYSYVIVNDNLDDAYDEFISIIKSEQLKVHKNTNKIQEVCKL